MLKKLIARVSGDGAGAGDASKSAGVAQPLVPSTSYGVPFSRAAIAAFDPVLELVAIAPHRALAAPSRPESGQAAAQQQQQLLKPPHAVYIVGAELAAVEVPTELDANAVFIDMRFIPGMSELVLLTSTRLLRISFGSYGTAGGEFVRCSLTCPVGDVRLTCFSVLLGLPFVAVGRSDGVVSFGNVFQGGWSKVEHSIPAMLAAVGMQQHIASNGGAGTDSLPTGASSLVVEQPGAVTSIVPFPSDPNTALATVRSFPGVVKWYLQEGRVSALFMLPSAPLPPPPAGTGTADSGKPQPAAVADHITSVTATEGGGYVVAATSGGKVFVWYEKGGKGSKDRVVTARYLAADTPTGPIRHLTLSRSEAAAESHVMVFVHNRGTSITELHLTLAERRATVLKGRTGTLQSSASPRSILSCIPIYHASRSPWQGHRRGPPTRYLGITGSIDVEGAADSDDSMQQLSTFLFAEDSNADAGKVPQQQGRTHEQRILCETPMLSFALSAAASACDEAACASEEVGPASLFPCSFLVPCSAPSLLERGPSMPPKTGGALLGGISPFELYSGNAPNDRAHIFFSLAPKCSTFPRSRIAAKTFPHSGIVAPVAGTPLFEGAKVVCQRALFSGRASLALGGPLRRILSLQWLMGSEELLPPPARHFLLEPFDWGEREQGLDFVVMEGVLPGGGAAAAAAAGQVAATAVQWGTTVVVRTSASNILVFSFAHGARVTRAFPSILLPQGRKIVSHGIAVYPAEWRYAEQRPSDRINVSNLLDAGASLSAAVVCGLDDRSVLTLDLITGGVLACKQLSQDDKKDKQKLGVTRVEGVSLRAAALAAAEATESDDDGDDFQDHVHGRNQRATAADVSVTLKSGIPTQRPFFMRSAVGIQLFFAERSLPLSVQPLSETDSPGAEEAATGPADTTVDDVESGHFVVVRSGSCDAASVLEIDLYCPLSSVIFGITLKCAEVDGLGHVLAVKPTFGGRADGATTILRPQVPASATASGTAARPVGIQVNFDAVRGVVEYFVVLSLRSAGTTAEEAAEGGEAHFDDFPLLSVHAGIAHIADASLWKNVESIVGGGAVALAVGGYSIRGCSPHGSQGVHLGDHLERMTLIDAVTGDPERFMECNATAPAPIEHSSKAGLACAPAALMRSLVTPHVVFVLGTETLVSVPVQDLVSSASSSMSSKVMALGAMTPKSAWQQLLLDESRDTLSMAVVDIHLVTVPRHVPGTPGAPPQRDNCSPTIGGGTAVGSGGIDEVACFAVLLAAPPHILILEPAAMSVVASVPLSPRRRVPLAMALRWCCNQLHIMLTSSQHAALTCAPHPMLEQLVLEPSDVEERAKVAAIGESWATREPSTWDGRGMRVVNVFASSHVAHDDAYDGPVKSPQILAFLPPRDDGLQATQKEQGFFKRLITASWSSQLEKVEALLSPLHQEDFDEFTKRVALEYKCGSEASRGGGAAAAAAAGRKFTDPAAELDELLGPRGASQRPGAGGRDARHAQAKGDMSQTRNTMNENMELLNERGEKISRLERKMADIDNEAAEFQRLCKQLREKEQKSWF